MELMHNLQAEPETTYDAKTFRCTQGWKNPSQCHSDPHYWEENLHFQRYCHYRIARIALDSQRKADINWGNDIIQWSLRKSEPTLNEFSHSRNEKKKLEISRQYPTFAKIYWLTWKLPQNQMSSIFALISNVAYPKNQKTSDLGRIFLGKMLWLKSETPRIKILPIFGVYSDWVWTFSETRKKVPILGE